MFLVIFVAFWALITIVFSIYTTMKVVQVRKQILKGNLDAMKVLKQINSGTYKEKDWL